MTLRSRMDIKRRKQKESVLFLINRILDAVIYISFGVFVATMLMKHNA